MPVAVPVTVELSGARQPPGLTVRTAWMERAAALASGLPIISTGVPPNTGPAIAINAKAGVTKRVRLSIVRPSRVTLWERRIATAMC